MRELTRQFPKRIHRDCMEIAFAEGYRAASHEKPDPDDLAVEYEAFIEENFSD